MLDMGYLPFPFLASPCESTPGPTPFPTLPGPGSFVVSPPVGSCVVSRLFLLLSPFPTYRRPPAQLPTGGTLRR